MDVCDVYGRPLRSLRVSVTDRCNLRCLYCMPEENYTWIPRQQILTFEEIDRLVGVFCQVGVRKVRITGGEPLLRRDLPALLDRLAARDAVQDLALTTNGMLLGALAVSLARAGLHRVTVSLDTLRPERFRELARGDGLPRVLEGIHAARQAGLLLKINTVVVRGFNDDELCELIAFGRKVDAEVRFIEYMDVGGATRWSPEQVVSRDEMLGCLEQRLGAVRPVGNGRRAPAERFRLPDGTTFGIIASTTRPFCDACDRSRLTADGLWLPCLYATRGLDLKTPLRRGEPPDMLRERIVSAWRVRDDRGAEQRLALAQRGPFIPLDQLRGDHHLEMHTRGG